jgi:hypothetical protein
LIPGPGWTYNYCGKGVSFLYPCVEDTFSSTAIEIIGRLQICSGKKRKVFPHLEAWVGVGRGILHSKDSLSLLIVQY